MGATERCVGVWGVDRSNRPDHCSGEISKFRRTATVIDVAGWRESAQRRQGEITDAVKTKLR